MNKINVLTKNERLEILAQLKAGELKIKDYDLEIHTGFSSGPDTMTIQVKSIYSKKHEERLFITEMSASEFFLITELKYINNIAIMSYKAIDKSMGIYKIDSTKDNEKTIYEELLFQTEEYFEFVSKALSE